ncbi:hypothetical protein [Sandarakinorhabdus sp. DWP1-3-1]|uniref:hypothetical protein n=1 Tax=Sandarakinorhabdus sp. DWP1-3-1 TaxID=2804627 RepID=UPI003CEBB56A
MAPRPLVPAPDSLGLASPAIGPWFASDLSLGAPDGDLAVRVTPGASTTWLPPARGVLSLHFATSPRPPALAMLRRANGAPAFADNVLVALFQLLPEVMVRLEALLANIPSPDGSAASVATRPMPRWFAIEASGVTTASTAAQVFARWVQGFAETTTPEKLKEIGLGGSDGALANAERPAQVLAAPGKFAGSFDELFTLAAVSHGVWAFDARGRAVDPGAAAAWLAYLATVEFDNLWAPGLDAGDKRTATAPDARSVYLVNAHEGTLTAALLARATLAGVDGAATDVVRRASGTAAVTVGFSAAPAPDDAPVPRAALLPHRAWGNSVSLWPAGPVDAALGRDYARVALVDVERHLTGQPRTPASVTPTAGEMRRAADQNRAATRVAVARAPGGDAAPTPLRISIDDAADALVDLLQDAAPALVVAQQLDRDQGPLPPLAVDPDPFPASLPTPTVRALVGGGTAAGSTIAGQRVLVEFDLDPVLTGAMLRLWPNGIDLATGRRKATDGGAGRVRADGKVSLVVLLPDGENAASQLGATAMIGTGDRTRLYGELRFPRPLAAGGAALAWSAAGGAIIACEQDRFAGIAAAQAAGLLPGSTLVDDSGGTASLIDPASVPAAAFAAGTVIRSLTAGDRVVISRPAFRAEPLGGTAALLGATGATATEILREGVLRTSGPGTPLPSQMALASAAAAFDATTARAVLFPPPALSRFHEIGPAQQGHPGSPAAPETAGVGIDLGGPAALLVAEGLSALADAATPALVAAAAARTSAPAEPAGAGLFVAALRTQAAGVEGERGLDVEAGDTGHPFPFDGDEAAMRTWYADHPSITIAAPAAGREAVQQRAMARRALAAARGLQEGAVALTAAFARAEDLVYLESPALDLLAIGSGEDILRPVQALADRLAANRALHAVICVPVEALIGAPKDLIRVRADTLKAALVALEAAAPGRVASFCPNAGAGRSLRIATTTVIVDDVFALTGSTALSRRGLSFDSSLSVAVFDEAVVRGRGASLAALRRALVAARLGLSPALVPDDGAQLVRAIAALVARGSGRLTTATLPVVDPPVTDSDRALWNRDGSVPPNPADLAAWLALLGNGNVLSSGT